METFFAGWKDPLDLGAFFNENVGPEVIQKNSDLTVAQYRIEYILRHATIENVTCQDPEWMESNTFYPKGTLLSVTRLSKTL